MASKFLYPKSLLVVGETYSGRFNNMTYIMRCVTHHKTWLMGVENTFNSISFNDTGGELTFDKYDTYFYDFVISKASEKEIEHLDSCLAANKYIPYTKPDYKSVLNTRSKLTVGEWYEIIDVYYSHVALCEKTRMLVNGEYENFFTYVSYNGNVINKSSFSKIYEIGIPTKENVEKIKNEIERINEYNNARGKTENEKTPDSIAFIKPGKCYAFNTSSDNKREGYVEIVDSVFHILVRSYTTDGCGAWTYVSYDSNNVPSEIRFFVILGEATNARRETLYTSIKTKQKTSLTTLSELPEGFCYQISNNNREYTAQSYQSRALFGGNFSNLFIIISENNHRVITELKGCLPIRISNSEETEKFKIMLSKTVSETDLDIHFKDLQGGGYYYKKRKEGCPIGVYKTPEGSFRIMRYFKDQWNFTPNVDVKYIGLENETFKMLSEDNKDILRVFIYNSQCIKQPTKDITPKTESITTSDCLVVGSYHKLIRGSDHENMVCCTSSKKRSDGNFNNLFSYVGTSNTIITDRNFGLGHKLLKPSETEISDFKFKIEQFETEGKIKTTLPSKDIPFDLTESKLESDAKTILDMRESISIEDLAIGICYEYKIPDGRVALIRSAGSVDKNLFHILVANKNTGEYEYLFKNFKNGRKFNFYESSPENQIIMNSALCETTAGDRMERVNNCLNDGVCYDFKIGGAFSIVKRMGQIVYRLNVNSAYNELKKISIDGFLLNVDGVLDFSDDKNIELIESYINNSKSLTKTYEFEDLDDGICYDFKNEKDETCTLKIKNGIIHKIPNYEILVGFPNHIKDNIFEVSSYEATNRMNLEIQKHANSDVYVFKVGNVVNLYSTMGDGINCDVVAFMPNVGVADRFRTNLIKLTEFNAKITDREEYIKFYRDCLEGKENTFIEPIPSDLIKSVKNEKETEKVTRRSIKELPLESKIITETTTKRRRPSTVEI